MAGVNTKPILQLSMFGLAVGRVTRIVDDHHANVDFIRLSGKPDEGYAPRSVFGSCSTTSTLGYLHRGSGGHLVSHPADVSEGEPEDVRTGADQEAD